MAERRYSISQAGRLVGVENHVLRYWEDELHLEIPRDRKNQRYYTKLHIEMFQKINELKEKGYQLKAIEPVLKRMLAGEKDLDLNEVLSCLLYTSPSPRDGLLSRMPSSA